MLFLFARSMKNRIKPFIGLLLIAMGVLLVGLSPYIRLRFDLSEEKKFTLSASSIDLLRQQDAPIRIKVFLGGDKLPAGFKRMEKALDSVDPDVIEVEQSSGVLTLKLARGAKIILSAQPSVRQLWLAMAVLGTAIHFDWQNGQWVDDKGQGKELYSTLSQVLREQTGLEISL